MHTARRFLPLPIASILLAAMLLPMPASAQNQNMVQSGDITVYYNALPTRSSPSRKHTHSNCASALPRSFTNFRTSSVGGSVLRPITSTSGNCTEPS